MNILRKAFKIFNGSSWDEYHLKTDSKQVVHTKADGTDTTVEEQLLTLNSTILKKAPGTYFRGENKTATYPSGHYLLFSNVIEGDQSIATISGNGIIQIKKAMTALVCIQVVGRSSASSTIKRGWIKLQDYNTKKILATAIAYGEFFSLNITRILELQPNSNLGVFVDDNSIDVNAGMESNSTHIEIIPICYK